MIVHVALADQQPPGKDQLQGKWTVIGGEEGGTAMSAEVAKDEDLAFAFKDESLVITRSGRVIQEFSVVVRPGKDKGEIDLKHKGGDRDGKMCHGIYALEGDILKICTASKLREDMAADRPNIFSTKESDKAGEKRGKLMFVLKREK